MALFFMIIGIAVFGIGAVVWLLVNEKKSSEQGIEAIDPEQITGSILTKEIKSAPEKTEVPTTGQSIRSKSSPFANIGFGSKKINEKSNTLSESETTKPKGLFGKFSFGKKAELDDIPKPTPFPSLKEHLEFEKKLKEAAAAKNALQDSTGTASIKVASPEGNLSQGQLSDADEEKINSEVNTSFELAELKEKYEKLDALFKEKNTELEDAKRSLENELKNRKEFNKVKDLLEKEIKDTKDKILDSQSQLSATKTEGDSYKKRIDQLEGKVTKLEKEINEKEKEIDTLVKRLQTFASPATASKPPIKEAPVQPASELKQKNLETAQETPLPSNPKDIVISEDLPKNSNESISTNENNESNLKPEAKLKDAEKDSQSDALAQINELADSEPIFNIDVVPPRQEIKPEGSRADSTPKNQNAEFLSLRADVLTPPKQDNPTTYSDAIQKMKKNKSDDQQETKDNQNNPEADADKKD